MGWGTGRRRPSPGGRGHTHVGPVPKGSVEGLFIGQEQLPDVTQAGNFEHLWFLLNHLPGAAGAMGRNGNRGGAAIRGGQCQVTCGQT